MHTYVILIKAEITDFNDIRNVRVCVCGEDGRGKMFMCVVCVRARTRVYVCGNFRGVHCT